AFAHVAEDAASAWTVARSAAAVWRRDRRASAPATAPGSRRRSIVLLGYPLDILASVLFELRLDPVDGVTIALRALPAIAELRQPLHGALVSLESDALT